MSSENRPTSQEAVLSPSPTAPTLNSPTTPLFNRIGSILFHIPYYTITGAARLAQDAGLSRSTISRLIRGQIVPSCRAVWSVTWAIATRFGELLDPSEIFSLDGTYPTPCVCDLMGCKGCLPPEAWCERTDTIKPEWRGQRPGQWSHQSQADLFQSKTGEWPRLEASPTVPGNSSLL